MVVPMGAASWIRKTNHACYFADRIAILFCSDGAHDKTRFDGFRLALSVETEADTSRLFDALAVDGTVEMPLKKTSWSPSYGMVTDRFSVGWMVMANSGVSS